MIEFRILVIFVEHSLRGYNGTFWVAANVLELDLGNGSHRYIHRKIH